MLREHTQGATYVNFDDMVGIHLFESTDHQTIRVVDNRPTRGDRRSRDVWIQRSWSMHINLLQTEDCRGFGTQFYPVPSFNANRLPTALTWTLFGILSSCPTLWQAVDSNKLPFQWSRWEVWVLTSIQTLCFKFDLIKLDKPRPPHCTPHRSWSQEKESRGGWCLHADVSHWSWGARFWLVEGWCARQM